METKPALLAGGAKPRIEYIDLLKAFAIFCLLEKILSDKGFNAY
jgi:hypothetical protein